MSVTVSDVCVRASWETRSSKIETTIFGTTRCWILAKQLTTTKRTTNVILFSVEVVTTLRALIDEGNNIVGSLVLFFMNVRAKRTTIGMPQITSRESTLTRLLLLLSLNQLVTEISAVSGRWIFTNKATTRTSTDMRRQLTIKTTSITAVRRQRVLLLIKPTFIETTRASTMKATHDEKLSNLSLR